MGFTTAAQTGAEQRCESTDHLNWRRARRHADRKVLSRLMARIDTQQNVRQDLVDRVRAKIADGTYESDEKLDTAIARLIDDL